MIKAADLATVKEELSSIKAFSEAAAEKLLSYPYQGLASHYLNNIAEKADFALSLLNKENENE